MNLKESFVAIFLMIFFVVTNNSSIRSFFDGSSVMRYEPDDEQGLANCVIELYKNPGRRAELAAAASAVYQKYRWSVMKYEYLNVYDRLTKG